MALLAEDGDVQAKIVNVAADAIPVYLTNPTLPEAAADFSDFLVQSVNANTTITKDKVIPNGKTATITNLTAILASTDTGNQDIMMRLIWDPAGANETVEIGRDISVGIPINRSFVGNGTKVLRISIQNGTTSALWLSSRYNGYQVNT